MALDNREGGGRPDRGVFLHDSGRRENTQKIFDLQGKMRQELKSKESQDCVAETQSV